MTDEKDIYECEISPPEAHGSAEAAEAASPEETGTERSATVPSYDDASAAGKPETAAAREAGPADAPPRPVRRIGTMTLGVALIVTGIAALLTFFIPGFDVVTALRLTPLILVFLGIEILAQYFTHKGEKLKYDLLSGFVCILLIAAGVFGMAAPTLYEYYGPKRQGLERRLAAELEDACYEQLPDGSDVSYLHINLQLGFRTLDYGMTYADLTAEDTVSVIVEFAGADGSREDFAAACRLTLDAIQRVDFRPETVHFSASDDERDWSLSVGNPTTNRLSAAELAERVSLYEFDAGESEYAWEEESSWPDSTSSYEETSGPEDSSYPESALTSAL